MASLSSLPFELQSQIIEATIDKFIDTARQCDVTTFASTYPYPCRKSTCVPDYMAIRPDRLDDAAVRGASEILYLDRVGTGKRAPQDLYTQAGCFVGKTRASGIQRFGPPVLLHRQAYALHGLDKHRIVHDQDTLGHS